MALRQTGSAFLGFFGRERNHLVTGLCLTFTSIGKNRLEVKIPFGRLLLARLPHLLHQFIFQHGVILPSTLPACKSRVR